MRLRCRKYLSDPVSETAHAVYNPTLISIEGTPSVMKMLYGPGLASALILISGPAAAYIGPGSGISLLGGLWGVLVAIVLAVGAVLIWPIRYLFRRLKRKFGGQPAAGPDESVESSQTTDAAETGRATGRAD